MTSLALHVSNNSFQDVNGQRMMTSSSAEFEVTDSTNHPPPHRAAATVGVAVTIVIAVTIGGNVLVCATILTSRFLRSATNYLILSLAMSDLLLGCLVLPLSALSAVDTVDADRSIPPPWRIGGEVLCNIYISCDVMLCTVSILTLFAISIDRYVAVTRPLQYRSIVTRRRVRGVNVAVWTFSFFMAFVPIHLGWNTVSGRVQNVPIDERLDRRLFNFTSTSSALNASSLTRMTSQESLYMSCEFELNRPYALLVACGTYFVPLGIMCAIYRKIFEITRRQTNQMNGGMRRTGGTLVAAVLVLEESGRTLARLRGPPPLPQRLLDRAQSTSQQCSYRGTTQPLSPTMLSPPLSSNVASPPMSPNFLFPPLSMTLPPEAPILLSPPFSPTLHSESTSHAVELSAVSTAGDESLGGREIPGQLTFARQRTVTERSGADREVDDSDRVSRYARSTGATLPQCLFNVDSKRRRLISERKATVTLASVLLAFVLCWAPYFTLFTLRPFGIVPLAEDGDATEDGTRSGGGKTARYIELFALWLGYLNSSINPFLYAFYSAAFRQGFRRVLCDCERRKGRASTAYVT